MHGVFGKGPTVVLHSNHDIEYCVDALRNSIDEEPPFRLWAHRKPLGGTFKGHEFQLWRQLRGRRGWSHSAFRFYGRLVPEMHGTRIEGYFNLDRGMKLYMRVWLISAILILGPTLIITVGDLLAGRRSGDGMVYSDVFVPLAVILGGWAFTRLGRPSWDEECFVVMFLQKALGARLDYHQPHPIG